VRKRIRGHVVDLISAYTSQFIYELLKLVNILLKTLSQK